MVHKCVSVSLPGLRNISQEYPSACFSEQSEVNFWLLYVMVHHFSKFLLRLPHKVHLHAHGHIRYIRYMIQNDLVCSYEFVCARKRVIWSHENETKLYLRFISNTNSRCFVGVTWGIYLKSFLSFQAPESFHGIAGIVVLYPHRWNVFICLRCP